MKQQTNIRSLAEIAVMTAVLCILGPISIPTGVVPISLTPFAVFLTAYILGMKKGTAAVTIYVLLGMAGIPVFSGYQGGFAKVAGPTGGYIIGFILMALICGLSVDRFYHRIPAQVIGMLIGLLVCYLFGTAWLKVQTGMTVQAAIVAGVLPFIGIDAAKLALAIAIGRPVRQALTKAGLLVYGTRSAR
jgi:biotin transport system substrate-specific component